MVSKELIEILRCPACVRNGPNAGQLDFINETIGLFLDLSLQ